MQLRVVWRLLLVGMMVGSLLSLSACSYGWKDAVKDSGSTEPGNRKRALDYFIDYLTKKMGKYGEYKRRQRAIEILGEMGEMKSINTFRVLLMHEKDAKLRATAIRSLARLRAPQALQEVKEALKSDRDPEVRMSAAAALGRMGDRNALILLVKALKDPKPRVRAAAVDALSELKAKVAIPYLIKALNDPKSQVRSAAEACLLRFDRSAIPHLIRRLALPASDERQRIIEFLPRYRKKVVVPVIKAFGKRASRGAAIQVLKKFTGEAQSWLLLKNMMEKISPKQHPEYIEQLSRMGSYWTIQAIFMHWYQMPSKHRTLFRETLGKIALKVGEGGRELLSQGAKRGADLAIRSTAILALGFTEKKAIPYLRPHLQAPQRVIVLSTLLALGRVGQDALRYIVPYFASKDEEILLTAIQAVQKIKHPTAVEQLITQLQNASAKIRLAALQALKVQKDRTAIPHIRKLLKDPINNVILMSIQTLLHLGDDQNIELYITAISRGPYPPDPSHVKTLGKLGDTKIVPLLKKLIRRYMKDWKKYVRKARRIYRKKQRKLLRETKTFSTEQREKLLKEITTKLAGEPARDNNALCSFTESIRSLMRLNIRVFTLLRKRGYKHRNDFNPVYNTPKTCPWPTIGVVNTQ